MNVFYRFVLTFVIRFQAAHSVAKPSPQRGASKSRECYVAPLTEAVDSPASYLVKSESSLHLLRLDYAHSSKRRRRRMVRRRKTCVGQVIGAVPWNLLELFIGPEQIPLQHPNDAYVLFL